MIAKLVNKSETFVNRVAVFDTNPTTAQVHEEDARGGECVR